MMDGSAQQRRICWNISSGRSEKRNGNVPCVHVSVGLVGCSRSGAEVVGCRGTETEWELENSW